MTGFDALVAIEAGFASPAQREAVRADEAALIDRTGFTLLLGGSAAVVDAIEECPGALAVFLRRRRGATSDAIAARLATLLEDHGRRGHEVVAGLDADHDRPEQLDGDVLLLPASTTPTASSTWPTTRLAGRPSAAT